MFYVGQKVVCVNAGLAPETGAYAHSLEEGRVYTVAGIATSRKGNAAVSLAEASPVGARKVGYLASRFRPIVERKTDISCFTDMLKPADERVTA